MICCKVTCLTILLSTSQFFTLFKVFQDFTYLDMRSTDFTYLDMRSTDFTYLDMRSTDFTYLDMRSTDFTYLDMRSTDFTIFKFVVYVFCGATFIADRVVH